MEWVLYSERKPEKDGEYLVVNSDGIRHAEYLWIDNVPNAYGRWEQVLDACGCCNTFKTDITHWMELPELPA